MKAHDLNINKLPSGCNLYIKVNITNEFKFRVWLATNLFKLAAAIIGYNIIISTAELEQD